MKRRALLLSGGISTRLNKPRYLNDIAAFYFLLVRRYGLLKSEVNVCYSMGGTADLDRDGVEERMAPADRAHVDAVFNHYQRLGPEDQIMLMVTNHGGPEGIALWGSEAFLAPEELGAALRSSPAVKVLILGQCFSGRFLHIDIGRAVVCTACGPDESSFACPAPPGTRPMFDEFLYHFVSALAGSYPDGKALKRPIPSAPGVTIGDAFRYARAHDRWARIGGSCREQPSIADPHGMADRMDFLARPM